MSEKRNPDEREIDTPLDLDDKAEIAHFEGEKEHHDLHTTLIEEALAQAEEESKMGLWKNFKLYYPGATFGLLLSVALVMEGYDTGLVGLTFLGCPSELAQPLYKIHSLSPTGQQLLRTRRLSQEVWDLPRREWEDFDSCRLASRCQQCSLRWSDPRSTAQRMGTDSIRIQDSVYDRNGGNDRLYFCLVLRPKSDNDFGWKLARRHPLGDLPSEPSLWRGPVRMLTCAGDYYRICL